MIDWLKKEVCLEYLGEDRRVLLEWIRKQCGGRIWPELFWLRVKCGDWFNPTTALPYTNIF
jgi:hypothetical protein